MRLGIACNTNSLRQARFMGLRKLAELDNSIATAGTEECSYDDLSSSSLTLQESFCLYDEFALEREGNEHEQEQPQEQQVQVQQEATKCVRFHVANGNDQVHCDIHQVESFKGKDLWLTRRDIQQTRNECRKIVQSSLEVPLSDATHKFLSTGWKQACHHFSNQPLLLQMTFQMDTRGLEHHIVIGLTERIEDHVLGVLKDQGTAVHECVLAANARQSSQPWAQLALLRAKFDAEEAAKPEISPVQALDFYS